MNTFMSTASQRIYKSMLEWLHTNPGSVEQVSGGIIIDQHTHRPRETKYWTMTLPLADVEPFRNFQDTWRNNERTN